MLRTLNNQAAKVVIKHAIDGDVRCCAYCLYNYYRDSIFDPITFKRLYFVVLELLGDKLKLLFNDETIDYCVIDFINRFYPSVC